MEDQQCFVVRLEEVVCHSEYGISWYARSKADEVRTESMGYWWEKLDKKPIIQGDELKKKVEFFEYNKESINLLPDDEQKLVSDLLIRAKIYLSYYEKDFPKL